MTALDPSLAAAELARAVATDGSDEVRSETLRRAGVPPEQRQAVTVIASLAKLVQLAHAAGVEGTPLTSFLDQAVEFAEPDADEDSSEAD